MTSRNSRYIANDVGWTNVDCSRLNSPTTRTPLPVAAWYAATSAGTTNDT